MAVTACGRCWRTTRTFWRKRQSPVQAEKLLEMGTGEIERTPFLTPEDKQFYRDGYLKTGILNLALNSPETAEAAADRYFPATATALRRGLRKRGA